MDDDPIDLTVLAGKKAELDGRDRGGEFAYRFREHLEAGWRVAWPKRRPFSKVTARSPDGLIW